MIKLLAWADAGNRTGFERVARGILTYLHTTGEYDVTCMGIGYRGQPEIKYPYVVRPASTAPEQDLLGVYDFQKAVEKYKPDVVWILQDLWNIQRYASLKDPRVPMAIYFPVDCPNMKWHYAMALGACGGAAAYTKFGATETAAGVRDFVSLLYEGSKDTPESLGEPHSWISVPHPMGGKLHARMDRIARFQNVEEIDVVPHGHEQGLFEMRDRAAARKVFDIPEDAFVILNVNTNQFRKRLDLTFRVFGYVAERVPKARLVLHCAGHTIQGWDLAQLAQYFGVQDRVHLIHETKDELTDDELVELYNTADIMINTSGGEGWGLTSFEAAACGVPQMVPDWSVTRDLWSGYGILIPVVDYRMEPKFLNTAHGVIDVLAAGRKLVQVARRQELLEPYREKALELVRQQLTWDQVGQLMERVIQKSLTEGPMQPTSLQACMDNRSGDVRSELFQTYVLGR